MDKFFIEAWYSNNTQMLGNMDGQAVVNAKKPLLTKAWKRIKSLPLSKLTTSKGPIIYKMVSKQGDVLQTIIKG